MAKKKSAASEEPKKAAGERPAKKAGGKSSAKCVLIPVEGDSAMTQICTGISHSLGWDYYGDQSLGTAEVAA